VPDLRLALHHKALSDSLSNKISVSDFSQRNFIARHQTGLTNHSDPQERLRILRHLNPNLKKHSKRHLSSSHKVLIQKLAHLRRAVNHMFPAQSWAPPTDSAAAGDQDEETDNSHRPPNAFILYTQAMRSSCRQENPSLSNTEVSRLLGKKWKDVPSDVKMQYKQKAAIAQEQFKRDHPNYTYRKARKKRALNELLTKSAQGFQMPGFPVDPNLQAMMGSAPNPFLLQMYGQGQLQAGQMLQQQQLGLVGQPGQGPPGMPQGYGGYPGMPGQGQPGMYQYPGK
jgi:transcription factor SOX7/8/10/18 (SOX group E/F)